MKLNLSKPLLALAVAAFPMAAFGQAGTTDTSGTSGTSGTSDTSGTSTDSTMGDRDPASGTTSSWRCIGSAEAAKATTEADCVRAGGTWSSSGSSTQGSDTTNGTSSPSTTTPSGTQGTTSPGGGG